MTTHHPIPLSPAELMAQARALTGIDLIDHAAVEPLTVLHRSLCEEGGLDAEGALAQQNKLIRLLSNRLRMQRDFARHPEIAEQTIERPLFVIGMARSGTTKTQKVLAASDDFNFLPFWKGYHWASFSGVPGESTEERVAQADAYCRWFDARSPEAKRGHAFETHEPEEDTTLTEGCLVAPSFVGFARCPSYLQWLSTQSPTPLFEFLRDAMKYLQWQGLASPHKRWLLKAPTYYGLEAALLHVFPDADIVMTHRSPLQTVPSSCKLVSLFHVPFSTAPVSTDMLCAGFAMMMNLHLSNRQTLPSLRILDLHFDEITRSMDTALDKIYRHISLPLSDASRQRMQQWEDTHPQHAQGGFAYSLAEFGLNADTLQRDMACYIAWMQERFGQ